MTRPQRKTALVEIGIDRQAREPIQAQILSQLRAGVLNGRLRPRQWLPSSRQLAADLGIARATVVSAYEQLVSEGYAASVQGSGTQIATELPEKLMMAGAGGSPALPRPPKRSGLHEAAKPFRTGLVDWEHFPHQTWARLLGRAWRDPARGLLEASDAFGWPPLREAIATHLFEWRGIGCDASQVIITAGSTDALDLVRRVALKPGCKVWMEDPCYPTARMVLSAGGIIAVPVPIDHEGLDVRRAMGMAPEARAAFVTPARHYPTGITMALARRLELLAWAEQAGAIIIEDDYDSEYRYVGSPLPALMSVDHRARVIYAGSFSKVFSPLLRLGFIVVPASLIGPFRDERTRHGPQPSSLAQPALAEFMSSGNFAAHIRRMRRIYASRRAALIEELLHGEKKLFEISASPSGLSLLLRLPQGVSDLDISARLAAAGIEVEPLSRHYAGRNGAPGLLLGFAGFAEKELRRAATQLLGELSP